MNNDKDIVVSTRVRLARNLKDYPFTFKLSKEKMEYVNNTVRDAILKSNSYIKDEFQYVDMSKLKDTKAVSLVERHLVSPEFISKPIGRGLLLKKDNSVSIMINEEDHIRLQVLKDGSSLNEAYDVADKIDTFLDEQLNFAFDERLGYLTACPTNLGTGMRASLMLHLPVLQENGLMNRIASNLSKLGITIRGTFGEGTKAKGSLYQLSNQVTLGLSERAAISNLKDISNQIIAQERKARENIKGDMKVLDSIGRSLGILKCARLINSDEIMNLLSNVRLGISMGVISDVSLDAVNRLIGEVQPATIVKDIDGVVSDQKRDEMRANLVREKLFN